MMLLLPRDVLPNDLTLRGADGKGSISLLPGELLQSDLVMDPFGRDRLQASDDIRERMGRPEANQKMNMIRHATDRLRSHFEIPGDTAQEGMQPAPPFRGDQGHPVFRAEVLKTT